MRVSGPGPGVKYEYFILIAAHREAREQAAAFVAPVHLQAQPHRLAGLQRALVHGQERPGQCHFLGVALAVLVLAKRELRDKFVIEEIDSID
jgi:hypothetical protein